MVALKVINDADKKKQDEFKAAETFNPAGLMVPPEESPKLVRWLYAGLLLRVRYTLVDADGTPTELAAAASDPDNWFTRRGLAGKYTVRSTAT